MIASENAVADVAQTTALTGTAAPVITVLIEPLTRGAAVVLTMRPKGTVVPVITVKTGLVKEVGDEAQMTLSKATAAQATTVKIAPQTEVAVEAGVRMMLSKVIVAQGTTVKTEPENVLSPALRKIRRKTVAAQAIAMLTGAVLPLPGPTLAPNKKPMPLRMAGNNPVRDQQVPATVRGIPV